MTTSESVIHINRVNKAFRRFTHAGWQALDALGMRVPASRYDTFEALRDINLDITRGEKVALIGRNGAGKSTLLRLICGQMRPDAGEITVQGNVQALMELGTGFHPDFTGLQNIRSALALQGRSRADIERATEDIRDFTELDEFLDRPVKEYSSGMYARLAFAVATAIVPEVLIIDEVLGAGDAYFMGKCIQRMKSLTGQGATVLFVSHDMGAVQMLCDRAIWLHAGSIREDGPLLPVSKAYLASVRREEEARLRARAMALTRQQTRQLDTATSALSLLRLIGEDGAAPTAPLQVFQLTYGTGETGECFTLSSQADDNGSLLLADTRNMNWRLDDTHDRQWLFGDFGGRFVHAPMQIGWPAGTSGSRWLELEVVNPGSRDILLDLYAAEASAYQTIGRIPAALPGRARLRFEVPEIGNGPLPDSTSAMLMAVQALPANDRYGDGDIQITGFSFFDDQGDARHTLVTGENASALIRFACRDTVTEPVAVIAIYRPDGICAMQVISSRSGYHFPLLKSDGGIRVDFQPLTLGPGEYVVSIALFKELNLASSVEPPAHDLHDRCYPLKMLPPVGIQVEIGVVNQTAEWHIVQ